MTETKPCQGRVPWLCSDVFNKSELCRRLYGIADRKTTSIFSKKIAGKLRQFTDEEIEKLNEIKLEIIKELIK